MSTSLPENTARPALVAFDMAGTTVDEKDVVYVTLREVTEGAGASYDDETFARWTGMEKRQAIAGLLGDDADEQTVDRVHREFVEKLTQRYTDEPPVAFPGIEDCFTRLHDLGVAVALTTGYDRNIANLLLGALGWDDDRFDAVVCATEVNAGRPAPDMIQRAMEIVGVNDPQRVWAVGDTAADVLAGNAAGAVSVGVLTGNGTAEQLSAESPDVILSSAAEVAGLAAGLEA